MVGKNGDIEFKRLSFFLQIASFLASRTEAAEILRGLVESIKVQNLEDGFEIELVGEIVNMIETAQTEAHKGKATSEEAASLKNYTSSVKVVAGVRNRRYLHLDYASL